MPQTPPKSISIRFEHYQLKDHAVPPADIDFLSATASTMMHISGKVIKDKATEMSETDTKKITDSVRQLQSLLKPNAAGTTLNTGITLPVTSFKYTGGKVQPSTVEGLINADYKGEAEANIVLVFDQPDHPIRLPVTHQNIEKVVKAYDAGAAAVKAMTTKLQNGGTPLSQDQIYSGVMKAMKATLETPQVSFK